MEILGESIYILGKILSYSGKLLKEFGEYIGNFEMEFSDTVFFDFLGLVVCIGLGLAFFIAVFSNPLWVVPTITAFLGFYAFLTKLSIRRYKLPDNSNLRKDI